MSLIKLVFPSLLLFIAPYLTYLGCRPPKGFSPDVTGQNKFVKSVSTTLLRPIIFLCGSLAATAFLLENSGFERLAFLTAVVSVALWLLMLIPGCLCFMQQIGGRRPRL